IDKPDEDHSNDKQTEDDTDLENPSIFSPEFLTPPDPNKDGDLDGQLGTGQSLPGGVRRKFESSYGENFANVRIHTDSTAAQIAREYDAAAFAFGTNIVFGTSFYQPGTPKGDYIIGHELAHVAQQRNGKARVAAFNQTPSVSDATSASEREANQAAMAAILGETYHVQRKADDDIQRLAPIVIIAGLALAAAVGLPDDKGHRPTSIKENKAKRKRGEALEKDSAYALVPFVGSYLMFDQAESEGERILGFVFLAMDAVSVGIIGTASRNVLKGMKFISQSQKVKQGTTAAKGVKTASTTGKATAASTAGKAAATEGGKQAIKTTAAEATEEIAKQKAGTILVGMEKGNHMVVYIREMTDEGLKWLKVQGGIGKSASKKVKAYDDVKDIRAYTLLNAGSQSVEIASAQKIAKLSKGFGAHTCSSGACKIISKSEIGVEIGKGRVAQLIPISVMADFGQPVRVVSEHYTKTQVQSVGQTMLLATGTQGIQEAGKTANAAINKNSDETKELYKLLNLSINKELTEFGASPTKATAGEFVDKIHKYTPKEIDLTDAETLKALYATLEAYDVEPSVIEAIMQQILRKKA
ncbi:MAG: DUF4157 domain-containing protein, partial [Cyanobacteria bacterium J06626_26]